MLYKEKIIILIGVTAFLFIGTSAYAFAQHSQQQKNDVVANTQDGHVFLAASSLQQQHKTKMQSEACPIQYALTYLQTIIIWN